ncbi:hypothetical protein BJ508DRAFT_410571 [Ascobolus immersus RN42]|uniref:Uncharacterized protein n=1 Tax=Ascobolus immersus RN42 TaxID=1160509 RepID=A0A3N4IQG3_ASCIM|nr:hypothetical protein BJ508DRAFT_410571 [Ascobolus immersus RN42]
MNHEQSDNKVTRRRPLPYEIEAPVYPLWESDCTHVSEPLQRALYNYCTNFFTIMDGFNDSIKPWRFGLNSHLQFFNPDYPVPLRDITNKYLLFFLEEFLPYLAEHSREIPHEDWIDLYQITRNIDGTIKERITAGLFREAQGRILEITIAAQINQLRALIMDPEANLDDFERSCISFNSRMSYLCEMRSERLELLLLQYLEEDGVNLDVAKGIEQATIDYEQLCLRLRASFCTDKGSGEELLRIWPRTPHPNTRTKPFTSEDCCCTDCMDRFKKEWDMEK